MIEKLPDSPAFRVDFSRVRQRGVAGWWRWFWGSLLGDRPKVDPRRVALGIVEVMRAATVRDVDGSPLVCNRFRVFLSQDDLDALRPLLPRMQDRIGALLDAEVERLHADWLGSWEVDPLVHDKGDLPPLHGDISPEFVAEKDLGKMPGEGTVRIMQRVSRTPRRRQPAPPVTPGPAPTGTPGSLSVTWDGGSATVPLDARRIFGRRHDHSVEGFEPLHGASSRIIPAHLWIENRPDMPMAGRLGDGGAVRVGSTELPPGGSCQLLLPAEIVLGGELRLTVKRLP